MSREHLQNMLNNYINDNHSQADMDLHNYLTAKMKQVAGLSPATAPVIDEDDNEDFNINDIEDTDD